MKFKRILLSVAGVLITAVSIGAVKFAAFGVDPFQSFMSGIDALIPIDFGTLYVLVNAALLLFALVFDRHYLGIATFINLFFLGYVVNFSLAAFTSLIPAPSIGLRALFFLLGFLFLCLGSSFYITADLGVSTYDAIALICSTKWKLGKFKHIRICTDLICILLGIGMYLLSGGAPEKITASVGTGTIATAFCMGPLVDFFNRTISVPMLHKQ